jgi:hypothetical protein
MLAGERWEQPAQSLSSLTDIALSSRRPLLSLLALAFASSAVRAIAVLPQAVLLAARIQLSILHDCVTLLGSESGSGGAGRSCATKAPV